MVGTGLGRSKQRLVSRKHPFWPLHLDLHHGRVQRHSLWCHFARRSGPYKHQLSRAAAFCPLPRFLSSRGPVVGPGHRPQQHHHRSVQPQFGHGWPVGPIDIRRPKWMFGHPVDVQQTDRNHTQRCSRLQRRHGQLARQWGGPSESLVWNMDHIDQWKCHLLGSM